MCVCACTEYHVHFLVSSFDVLAALPFAYDLPDPLSIMGGRPALDIRSVWFRLGRIRMVPRARTARNQGR